VNCQLPIANYQLFAARRGFARRCKNGRQFSRFVVQVLEPVRGYKLIFTDQLQPKLDFVSFLFGDTDLCNKFSARTGFARCPVICRSRGASACNFDPKGLCLSRLAEVGLPNSERGERTSSYGFLILPDS